MTNAVRYAPATDDDNRLLSPNVWRGIDLNKIRNLRDGGVFYFDDFHSGGAALTSNHSVWTGAAGSGSLIYDGFGTTGVTFTTEQTAADGDMFGVLTATTDADDEEAYISLNATYGGPLGKISDTASKNNRLAFEARVKFSDVASGAAAVGKMVGLGQTSMAATGTFGADAASTGTLEFVGFRAFAADGNGMDATHFDAAEVVVMEAASNTTLDIAADTWVKYGLYFDGQYTWWYIDGEKINTTGVLPAATNFPDGEPLVPVFGIRQHGTIASVTMKIDWWAFAQTNE